MSLRGIALCLLLCAGQLAAASEPCVGAAFDKAFPGATEVLTRQVDVPSPQFPGIWQEGKVEGYSYALFANGEGVLKGQGRPPDWELNIICGATGTECEITQLGNPPPAAPDLATRLGYCLQGVAEVKEPAVTPAPPVAPEQPSPCGVAIVPEGSQISVLQHLLVAAGADPGPVDGFWGDKTKTALISVLGTDARDLAVAEAIVAVDKLLCTEES